MRKPPVRRFGFRSARSWLRHSHASLHHIFFARKNATHFSLSSAKKRRLQPERYVQYDQNHNLLLKHIDKIIKYSYSKLWRIKL
jgi:hypothetical protein